MSLTPFFLKGRVDCDDPQFIKVFALVFLCPLIWNIVARTEYYFKPLRRLLGGPSPACYAITAWVFFFSTYRDFAFRDMVDSQPKLSELANSLSIKVTGGALMALGQLFVWSSAYRLGITGTFLGDYCGILMKERVAGFPFNVLEHPMYVGSTLSFLGAAFWNGSLAGILMTLWIYICYMVASIYFEGPFTTHIYEEAARKKAKKN